MQDYAELVLEAAHRCAIPDATTRAAQAVGFAERMLSDRLRVGEQEASATLTTDADGGASLPADYVAVRSLRVNDCEFPRETLRRIREGRRGYAVSGGAIVSSAAEADHALDYYAALPGLAANGTNWLLQRNPELYLYAVMAEFYKIAGAIEPAAIAMAQVERLLEEERNRDIRARFEGTRMRVAGGGWL